MDPNAALIAALEADNHDGSNTEYIAWLKEMQIPVDPATDDEPAHGVIRWIDGATGDITYQKTEVTVDKDGNVNLKL